jgi:hypothetical protein
LRQSARAPHLLIRHLRTTLRHCNSLGKVPRKGLTQAPCHCVVRILQLRNAATEASREVRVLRMWRPAWPLRNPRARTALHALLARLAIGSPGIQRWFANGTPISTAF